MQHPFHRQEKFAPVVVRVVLGILAVCLIAAVVWYLTAETVSAHRHEEQERAFESAELQFLMVRVSEIERLIHLPPNR